MALQGSLKEFSPVELLQLPASGKKTCELRILSSAGEARLFFDKGAVVHAEYRETVGEDVLREIVGWKDGTFEMLAQQAPPVRTIEKDISVLILSALKQNEQQRQADAERGQRQTKSLATTAQTVLEQWVQNGGAVMHLSVFDATGTVMAQASDRERAADGVQGLQQLAVSILGSYPRKGLRRVLMDDAAGMVAISRLDDARFLLMLAGPGTQPGALSLCLGKIAAQLAAVELLK